MTLNEKPILQKEKDNISNTINVDEQMKTLFSNSIEGISLTDTQKQNLVSIKDTVKPLKPWELFLEKEISIPIPTFATVVGVAAVSVIFICSSLLLPGDVPQPTYQIIEMYATNTEALTNASLHL